MSKTKKIVDEALSLSPKDRIAIVDDLLISLDQPDPIIDSIWIKESENRVKKYKEGKLKSVSVNKSLSKYRKAKAA